MLRTHYIRARTRLTERFGRAKPRYCVGGEEDEMAQKDRIVNLQQQVKVARDALKRIAAGSTRAEWIAEDALDDMWRLDDKQPLQGIVGHARRAYQ